VPTTITDKLKSWASELDPQTLQQAERTSRLPFVEGHVALMPDAHLGIGATVGSVIPTNGAIIPAAVGVDIGCGMIAVRTSLDASHLPQSLDPLLSLVEASVPAGVGKGHVRTESASRSEVRQDRADAWLAEHRPRTELSPKQERTAQDQFGTLGAGNHFLELCLDETDRVWMVLHSGSRGIGNQLAQGHIKKARGLAAQLDERLEDPDLASFVEGTEEFAHYVADLLWAQAYAAANRDQMMDEALRALRKVTRRFDEELRVNCHHNYTAREHHGGKDLWITRKGAIRAGAGELGVIPGSMGAASFVVEGRGNAESFCSCSHGAGRRMSRGEARRSLTAHDLKKRMQGRTWLASRAADLVDEHPDAYKDIHAVMRDQEDLVVVRHTLRQVLNYKGV
jgi:RNA-splicing ligase RtcB